MAYQSSSDGEETAQLKITKSSKKKKWNEEITSTLIDMLEERPCLWDIFNTEYAKRDKREKAYEEITDVIELDVKEIKSKIHNLRAQLGRELNKVKRTKSGQSTSERYVSNWVYWDRLQFLVPQMQPSKQRDNLDNTVTERNESKGDDVIISDDDRENDPSPPPPLKKSKRNPKGSRFEAMLAKNNESKRLEVSPFALYVDQKLKEIDPKTRFIVEKIINDVIFEAQFQNLTPTRNHMLSPSSHVPPQDGDPRVLTNQFTPIQRQQLNQSVGSFYSDLLNADLGNHRESYQ